MENPFNLGDLVWAKVDRHPCWPSIIYHEVLTSAEARHAKKEDCVLVSFFGDNSCKWFDPKKLFHFESNYSGYSNRSRTLLFVKAINDAVYEVVHRAAIGMTCPCVFFASYRPLSMEGLLKVDLAGYQSGGFYTVQQIERFRQEFRSVQELALDLTNQEISLYQGNTNGYQVMNTNRNLVAFVQPSVASHPPTAPMPPLQRSPNVGFNPHLASTSRMVPLQNGVELVPRFVGPTPPVGVRVYQPRRQDLIVESTSRHLWFSGPFESSPRRWSCDA